MSDLHLNGFGVNPIVLGVRADEFHVDGLEAICHRDHQAIFIALNIEDDPAILQNAGATVLRLDGRWLIAPQTGASVGNAPEPLSACTMVRPAFDACQIPALLCAQPWLRAVVGGAERQGRGLPPGERCHGCYKNSHH